jgi:hypothetical protein
VIAKVVARVVRALAAQEAARTAIVEDTGVSLAMATWALDAAAVAMDERSIADFHAVHGGSFTDGEVAIGLARSVGTAPLRSIAVALLRGASRVRVRCAGGRGAFALCVADAFGRAGFAVRIDRVPEAERWLQTCCDEGVCAVVAFGSDARVARARAVVSRSPGVQFEGYAHGVGASWCDPAAVNDEALEAIAWDFCAFDGHGCLSPAVLWVSGGDAQVDAFAGRLATAMARWSERIARGAVDRDARVIERQWRAEAAAASRWCASGRDWSVTVLDPGRGLGIEGIGGRNALLRAWGDGEEGRAWVRARLQWLSVVAGPPGEEDRWVQDALPEAGSHGARRARWGRMQEPPFDGEADGRAPIGR